MATQNSSGTYVLTAKGKADMAAAKAGGGSSGSDGGSDGGSSGGSGC